MKFEDVLEIKNGRNQRNVEDLNGKYPIYGSGGIIGYANDYICDSQTVVIGRKGSINNPLFVTEPFWNVDTAFGLIAKRDVLLPRYLYYFCKNYDFEKLNKTVTIPSLTKVDLLKIEINLPGLEKQQNVVNVLDKIKELIDKRKQQLQQLDELVKARFVELFGTPLVNEKEWSIKNTGEICVVTDGSHFSPLGKDEGYPMLSVKNMRKDGFNYNGCKLVSQEDYELLVKQGCKPLIDDVLIAKDGSYFYYGFVVKEEIEQAVLSSIAILRPNKEQINPEFLCRYMLSNEIVDLVGKNYVTGAAIKRVILKGIKQIPIMMPPLELQNEFATFVEQVDKSKFVIQKALDEAQTLFDSLMQKYFG